jgi:hypothetical protein
MVETQIISQLTGTLTPDMIMEIQQPALMHLILGFVIAAVALGLFIWFFSFILRLAFPKSKEYRSLLADMYVVGMVKKLAEEDDIDLIKELKDFSRIEKKKKLSVQDIDSVIEDNLKEKINAKAEKVIEKIEED